MKSMELLEGPKLGPNDTWSVSTLLFAALSGLLSAVLYLYRGRENDHTSQINELKTASAENRLWIKELQVASEKCQEDRSVQAYQIKHQEQEIAQLRNELTTLRKIT